MSTQTMSVRPSGQARRALDGWFASVDDLLAELGDAPSRPGAEPVSGGRRDEAHCAPGVTIHS